MTVLVAYRPTAEGKAALEAATTEAKGRGDELLLVRHVQVSDDDSRLHEHNAEVEADLKRLADEIEAQGVTCRSDWTVGPEKASRAILEVIERESPSLVVIGLRRRSPVGKLVLGSDAQDILLATDAPVLAVKASA